MPAIAIRALLASSTELATVAAWRIEAFGGTLGRGVAEETASLAAFVADPTAGAALVATRADELAGTCLLVPEEIDPLHAVAPWLAGLYVSPPHRRLGVGAALVRAIEQQAHRRGHRRLHLYTTNAEAWYARLGWRTDDRFDWKGHRTVLMVRDLDG